MGVVYRAIDARLGRKVALKVLPAEYGDDETFRANFLRESRLAASIEHRGVIPIYEAGEVDGRLYIAMRHVDGSDLAELLRAKARSTRRARWGWSPSRRRGSTPRTRASGDN